MKIVCIIGIVGATLITATMHAKLTELGHRPPWYLAIVYGSFLYMASRQTWKV